MSDFSPPFPDESDPDVLTAIRADLQLQLYGNLPISQATATFGAAVCALLFQDAHPSWVLLSWFGYMVLVSAARVWSRAYFQAGDGLSRPWVVWQAVFLSGVALSAVGWATAVVVFFDPTDVARQLFLMVTVTAVAAASVAHLSASFIAVAIMLGVTLIPLAILYVDQADGITVAALIGLFLAVMLSVGWRNHTALLHNARLSHRNRKLVARLTEHAAELEAARAQDEAERELALSVFEAIVPRQALGAPNLAYHHSGQSAFNGDLLLVEKRPDGRQHIMLGDFTGHGLAASLGAIPTADIFIGMTRKGFPLGMIVSEINRKLYTHLPANVFCAATLVEVDVAHARLRIWNGGLPSVYLIRIAEGDRAVVSLPANNLPLGVLPANVFDASLTSHAFDVGDLLFMATDGVTEQRDHRGEMFGDQRLEALLKRASDVAPLAADLRQALSRFSEGVGQDDDTTFVAFRADPASPDALPRTPQTVFPARALQLADWSLRLELQASAMRRVDPVPLLKHLASELNGPDCGWSELELVLGELYQNALDHGVLKLSSALKHADDGFEQYYAERDARLAGLREGVVTVELVNRVDPEGGVLEISVRDSGSGFDFKFPTQPAQGDMSRTHGRGLALATSLCHELAHQGAGNHVRATLRWHSDNAE